MAFADIGGVRLFYSDDGHGDPPMLLVHGYTCDSHDWVWQLPHFAATHRVIAVDLRGHGRSSAPLGGYAPHQLAADLAGLLEHLSCGPVIAVGHSLGGLIVSVLAAEHPGAVRAVVAVDPAYLVPDELAAVTASLTENIADDPVALVQALVGASHAEMTPAFLRTWHTRRVATVAPHVLEQTLLGMRGTDSLTSIDAGRTLLRRRTCPVLSVWSDPARAAADAALFSDPRSEVVVWRNAGHWPHQVRAGEFNDLVDDWLGHLDLAHRVEAYGSVIADEESRCASRR